MSDGGRAPSRGGYARRLMSPFRRFYERLGDHAVNLARRIEMLHGSA